METSIEVAQLEASVRNYFLVQLTSSQRQVSIPESISCLQDERHDVLPSLKQVLWQCRRDLRDITSQIFHDIQVIMMDNRENNVLECSFCHTQVDGHPVFSCARCKCVSHSRFPPSTSLVLTVENRWHVWNALLSGNTFSVRMTITQFYMACKDVLASRGKLIEGFEQEGYIFLISIQSPIFSADCRHPSSTTVFPSQYVWYSNYESVFRLWLVPVVLATPL